MIFETAPLRIRPATPENAIGMSRLLTAILKAKNSPRPSAPEDVLARYIEDPDRIACTLAEAGGEVIGFQSLKRARAGNPYGVTPGWGIIGTYVDANHNGRGIGRRLFEVSHRAAKDAGLPAIDASIGHANAGAQAYYAAMGFQSYGQTPSAVMKKFTLS